MGIWIGIGVALVIILYLVGQYNSLVRRRNQVKNSWAQIDVQLKRRHDLIPNLVETVKGYMQHERQTLDSVTQARQQAVRISGTSVGDQAKAETALSQSLRSLFAVAENYPDLKANQNFLALQEELTSTENKIGFARQFYNDSVMDYNNRIESFPPNLMANMFGFKPEESFEIETPAEREAPKVSFSG